MFLSSLPLLLITHPDFHVNKTWIPVKYANICEYLRNQGYPSDFSKHDKTVLRKFSKKIVYDERAGSLFYLDKARDGTVNRRLVIQEDEKRKFSTNVTRQVLLAMLEGTIQ